MIIVIITATFDPGRCGISDHSSCFAEELRRRGNSVSIIAYDGNTVSDKVHVDSLFFTHSSCYLIDKLYELSPDLVVLQFTPLLYSFLGSSYPDTITRIWKTISLSFKTALIIHESYFRSFRFPLSLLRCHVHKRLLKNLISLSEISFTSSIPIIREFGRLLPNSRLRWLPIGSNIPLITSSKSSLRYQLNIRPNENILVLFGGGKSFQLMHHYITMTEKCLTSRSIDYKILLLGNIDPSFFHKKSNIIQPGFLSPSSLSHWLTASDIMLMPHFSGLSSKRGTLITALQHRLPVVGLRTSTTDYFWNTHNGILLVPKGEPSMFASTVSDLALSSDLRLRLGTLNSQIYHQTFTWARIIDRFFLAIAT